LWSTVRDGARGSSPGWQPAGSAWVLGVLLLLAACQALAAGTPAGTQILNRATISYSVQGRAAAPEVAISAPVVVARTISSTVTWQDSSPLPVNSPDAARVLAFVVTNTGNGTETFKLSRDNAVAGDQFDPQSTSDGGIRIESGAQPGLQLTGAAADSLYVPGVTDLTLAPDASQVVYLLSDIPTGIATGALGRVALAATATTPGAVGSAPGAAVGVFNGVQVVVGPQGAIARGAGTYLEGGVSLGLAKSVAGVRDPSGGSRVMPGSVLTYRLVLTLTGSGVAEAVNVSDPLPATVTYLPGTATVDGAARTDAADADEISVTGNTLQANFGNVPAPGARVIEFKATVN
jgi:uncharacterized repeat protein (TIGR01451 family)